MSYPDFLAVNHGSVVQITPLSKEAFAWCDDNLEELEPWQRQGESFAIDHRLAQDILIGMRRDGLLEA
jgi:hypothetical protein